MKAALTECRRQASAILGKSIIGAGFFQILTSSPRLKPGDSSCETLISKRENVPGRIDIAVMTCTARHAGPFSYSKS